MDTTKRKNNTWISFGVIFTLIIILITFYLCIYFFIIKDDPRLDIEYRKNVMTSSIDIESEKEELHKIFKKKQHITNPTIFVAISSFRDPELVPTLNYFWKYALCPNRVYFGVVEQNDPKEDDPKCFAENSIVPKEHLRIHKMHYTETKGPTWARYLCENLWKQETYHLMTDSHMRCEVGWDVLLIDMLHKCARPQRSILTIYPEGYLRIETENGMDYKIKLRKGYRHAKFTKFDGDDMPHFAGYATLRPIPKKPTLTPFWAAGFHFSHSDSIRLCHISPNTPFLFFGEEIMMAARYWTSGFDLYAPNFSVLYHLWDRTYRKTFFSIDNRALQKQSAAFVKQLLTGKVQDKEYGLGDKRTIWDFWQYVGLDPIEKKELIPKDKWKPPKSYKIPKDKFYGKIIRA